MSKKVPTIDEVIDILEKVRKANGKVRQKYKIILNNYLQNMKQVMEEAVQAGYFDDYDNDSGYNFYLKILLGIAGSDSEDLRNIHNEITEKIIL